jgi:calcineurin-like phosphoesterase family protein
MLNGKKLTLPEKGRLSGRLFFTSDLHLFHSNILKHCPERGAAFSAVEDMNRTLVAAWNSTVGEPDTVIVAGDYIWKGRGGNPRFSGSEEDVSGRFRDMCRITRSLNGTKYLVKGNHDKFSEGEYLEAGFAGYGNYGEFESGNGPVLIVHSPKEVIREWYAGQGVPGYFDDMPLGYSMCFDDILRIPGRYICGHVHQLWRRLGPFVNIGVDVWDMRPVHIERILDVFREEKSALLAGGGGNGNEHEGFISLRGCV